MTTCKANSCYDSTNYSWNDYCSYHENCLSKLREYNSISDIQELETFETRFREDCYDLLNKNCAHFANMCIYGINYSEEIEENSSLINSSVNTLAVADTVGVTGLGVWGVLGSIALAPATGGASFFFLGATSAFGAVAGNVAVANAMSRYELNNGKGSTIKLSNEMDESNNKLGERDN